MIDHIGASMGVSIGHQTKAGEAWALPGQVGMAFVAFLKRTYRDYKPTTGARKTLRIIMAGAPINTHQVVCLDCGKVFASSTRAVRCKPHAEAHAHKLKLARSRKSYDRQKAAHDEAVGRKR
jgi:hypothetical protein